MSLDYQECFLVNSKKCTIKVKYLQVLNYFHSLYIPKFKENILC